MFADDGQGPGPDGAARSGDSTGELLRRARVGDASARDALCARYLEPLVRFARGRVPAWARGRSDTEDVVQDVLFATIRNLSRFDMQRPGALESYLRKGVDNRIKDLIREARRHPAGASLPDDLVDAGASPLTEIIGRESLERYEKALSAIPEEARGLVIARVELDLPYAEIALAFHKPTADAARMAVGRALLRLAEEMAHDG